MLGTNSVRCIDPNTLVSLGLVCAYVSCFIAWLFSFLCSYWFWLKLKDKTLISSLMGNPMTELQGFACHMGSHNVTCHSTQVNTPRLNPSQLVWLVLDLPTLEGWRAELSYVPWLRLDRESHPRSLDGKSDVLTVAPPTRTRPVVTKICSAFLNSSSLYQTLSINSTHH